MNPKEAFDFIKSSVTLPVGVNATLEKNTIVIGNKDVNFVLSGDLLMNEETIMYVIGKSSVGIKDTMAQVFAEKAAAAKLDIELKNKLSDKIKNKRK